MITRTDEIVSKAGPKSELGRQRRKAGLELKQDMELSILANKASVAGSDMAVRVSAGFAAWIKTNDQRDAGGADGGFVGPHVTAATNSASKRAFTKGQLDAAILCRLHLGRQSNGADGLALSQDDVLLLRQHRGRSYLGRSNPIRGKEQMTIYAAADTYLSDFGVIDVMPNRNWPVAAFFTTRNAYLIDLSKVAVGILDDCSRTSPPRPAITRKGRLL